LSGASNAGSLTSEVLVQLYGGGSRCAADHQPGERQLEPDAQRQLIQKFTNRVPRRRRLEIPDVTVRDDEGRSGPTQAGSVFARTAHTRRPAWGQAPGQGGPCNRQVGRAMPACGEYPSPRTLRLWCLCVVFFHEDFTPRSRSLPPRRLTSTVGTFGSARGQPPGLDGAGGTLRDRRSGHA
jgi:hypothetical protein